MHEFYMNKKKKILKRYRKLTNRAEVILLESYDSQIVNRIKANTLVECEGIISRLPYIGGKKNAFTPIIELNGWIICLYKAMKKESIDVSVTAYIAREIFDEMFLKVPKWIGLIIGKLLFTQIGIRYFKKQAVITQKREFSGDFVYSFDITKKLEGEKEVEFKFKECAVHKFYDAEEADELKQFCNFGDPLYSEHFKMGVNADHTFAQGHNCCILNYNNKRKTETPDNIIKMLDDARNIMSKSITKRQG